MIRTQEIAEADVPDRTARGIMDLGTRQGNIYAVDPRLLRVDAGFNARLVDFDADDEVDLALARSIAEVGVKQPLTVYMRDGEPTVTDGHRRLGATLYAIDVLGADIKAVPVQTEPKYASPTDRAYSVLLRNDSRHLAPIERANQYAKLIGFGHSEAEIASKIGRSRQHVADMLALRAGPQAVVEMVQSGEVSATLATQAIKAAKGDEAVALERLTEGARVAEAAGKKRITAKHLKPKPQKAADGKDGDEQQGREEPKAPKNSNGAKGARGSKSIDQAIYRSAIERAIAVAEQFLLANDEGEEADSTSGEVWAVRQIIDTLRTELPD